MKMNQKLVGGMKDAIGNREERNETSSKITTRVVVQAVSEAMILRKSDM